MAFADQKPLLRFLGADKDFKPSDIEPKAPVATSAAAVASVPVSAASGAFPAATSDSSALLAADSSVGAENQRRVSDIAVAAIGAAGVGAGAKKARIFDHAEPDSALAAKHKRSRVSFAVDSFADGEERDAATADADTIMMDENVLESQKKYHEFLDTFDTIPYDANSKEDQLKFSRDDFGEFLDFDIAQIDKQLRREIPMTDISSLMNMQVSTNKPIQFSNIVLDTLRTVKREEKIRERHEKQRIEKLQESEKAAAAVAIVQRAKDPRINESAMWEQYLGGEEDLFENIDTTGSNLLAGFSKTRDKDVAAAEAAAVATSAVEHQQQVIKQRQQQQLQRKQQAQRRPRAKYIVVPAAISSLLTIFNARSLLEHGSYKTTDECRKQNPSTKKPRYVSFTRQQGKYAQEFRIIEDPCILRKEDWERVVAIFTDGREWQFKGWITENPTELFTKYQGFHLSYEDTEPNDNIKNWPVKVLKVRRGSIHSRLSCQAVLFR